MIPLKKYIPIFNISEPWYNPANERPFEREHKQARESKNSRLGYTGEILDELARENHWRRNERIRRSRSAALVTSPLLVVVGLL